METVELGKSSQIWLRGAQEVGFPRTSILKVSLKCHGTGSMIGRKRRMNIFDMEPKWKNLQIAVALYEKPQCIRSY